MSETATPTPHTTKKKEEQEEQEEELKEEEESDSTGMGILPSVDISPDFSRLPLLLSLRFHLQRGERVGNESGRGVFADERNDGRGREEYSHGSGKVESSLSRW